MSETWKDIPEYEGLYQINEIGEIKTLDKVVKNAKGFRKTYGRESRGIDMKNKDYKYLYRSCLAGFLFIYAILIGLTIGHKILVNRYNEYIKQLEQSLQEQIQEKQVYINILERSSNED